MRFKGTVILLCFLLLGCGYYRHVDPVLYVYDSQRTVEESARLEARDKGGWVTKNVCCGSMRPTVVENDLLVVIPSPFGDHLKGKVVVYRPQWNKGEPVMHRLVSGSAKDGFIASGDNNPQSEAYERVRADNFVGEVISIYRLEKIP